MIRATYYKEWKFYKLTSELHLLAVPYHSTETLQAHVCAKPMQASVMDMKGTLIHLQDPCQLGLPTKWSVRKTYLPHQRISCQWLKSMVEEVICCIINSNLTVMTTPSKDLKLSLKFIIKSEYAWRGDRPFRTGNISHPREMYSMFLLPNRSVYAISGSLSISSSTHWGREILQHIKLVV